MVAMLAITEYTVEQSAKLIIDPKTGHTIGVAALRKHFREELDAAKIRANAGMAAALYKSGMGGNVTAQIFWLKTRLGWKEVRAPARDPCASKPHGALIVPGVYEVDTWEAASRKHAASLGSLRKAIVSAG